MAILVERLCDIERSEYMRHRDRNRMDSESLSGAYASSEAEESVGFRHVGVELAVGSEESVRVEFLWTFVYPFVVVHGPASVSETLAADGGV